MIYEQYIVIFTYALNIEEDQRLFQPVDYQIGVKEHISMATIITAVRANHRPPLFIR